MKQVTPPVLGKYKVSKILNWFAINTAFAYCLFLFYMGSVVGENIFTFFTWLMFILYSLVGLSSTNKNRMIELVSKKEKIEYANSVPKWLDLSYDILIICCLAGMGEFLLASIYTISTLMLGMFQENYNDAVENVLAQREH